MTGTFTRRRLTPDDAQAWAALLQRVSRTDPTVVAFTPPVVATWFDTDFPRPGPPSTLGIWNNDTLVAYARVRQDGPESARLLRFAGTVDPAFRGRGLGSEIVMWNLMCAQRWAHIVGTVRVIVDAHDSQPTLRRVLDRLGFRHAGTFKQLRCDVEAPAAVEAPTIRIEAFAADRLDDITGVYREVTNCRNADTDLASVVASPSFRQQLSFLAVDASDCSVVGYLLATHTPELDDRQIWIEALGVRRRDRGRRVSEALINAVLGAGVHGQFTSVGVGAHDDDGATGHVEVYRALGFTVTKHWHRMTREVAAIEPVAAHYSDDT